MPPEETCPPLLNEESLPDLTEQLQIFKLLSNPIRLKIALLLTKDERCTCHLESLLNMEQSLISHHLRGFKELSLLDEKRKGRWRYYSIKETRILQVLKALGL